VGAIPTARTIFGDYVEYKLLKILGLFILAILEILVHVFILNKIWNLTVVPIGAPHLTWLQMFGIRLFLSAISSSTCVERQDRTMDNVVVDSLVVTCSLALSWLLAYLVFG